VPHVPKEEGPDAEAAAKPPSAKLARQVKEGTGAQAAPVHENSDGVLSRDEVKGLLQNYRSKVDPEYQELLEEYYKALAK